MKYEIGKTYFLVGCRGRNKATVLDCTDRFVIIDMGEQAATVMPLATAAQHLKDKPSDFQLARMNTHLKQGREHIDSLEKQLKRHKKELKEAEAEYNLYK